MKTKKIVALTMSVALALGAASMIAACKDPTEGEKPGGSSNYVEDTTVYHCAGQSAGPDGSLYEQGWNQTSAGATESVTFVKDTTVTDKNVFTLTMKLYAGDMFKIVHDESWDGEISTYYFTNADEDSTYNYVAKTDGEIVFRNESGSSSNITLEEGHDGIYKFTLVTDPSATDAKQKYQLSYELVESIGRLQIPYKMVVKGSIDNFNSLSHPYSMSNSNGVWSILVNITEDDLLYDEDGTPVDENGTHAAVYVRNIGDGTGEADEKMEYVDETLGVVTINDFGGTYTVNLLTEGKWAITFNQETKTVTVSELAYELYFIGGWYAGSEDGDYGWEQYEGYKAYPLTSNSDGTIWTGTLDLSAQTGATEVKLFNALGTGNKYLPGSMSGNFSLQPGKYVFQYNTETDTATYQKYEFYVVGTLVDEDGNDVNFAIKDGFNPILTATDVAGVYEVEIEVEDVKELSSTYSWIGDSVCAIKVAWGTQLSGIADSDWYGGENDNIMISEAGTYVVTLNLNAEGAKVSVAPKAD